jgi:hypothetical protein
MFARINATLGILADMRASTEERFWVAAQNHQGMICITDVQLRDM